jgi:hypothetical protein
VRRGSRIPTALRGLVAALLLALPGGASPAAADPPGFAFLEIPAGARASALGGAGVTMTEGAEGRLWNPASLDRVQGVQLSASHYELYEGLRNDDFVLAGRQLGGGLSASLRALYSEPISERDETGTLIGSFGASDLQFGVGYGAQMATNLAFGVSFDFVREKLAGYSAQTWAVALGADWRPGGPEGLRAGLALRNLGPSGAYTIEGVKGQPIGLPSTLQGGVSYPIALPREMRLRAALEGQFVSGHAGVGIVAAEFGIPQGVELRAGWRVNDEFADWGVGIGWRVGGLRLDYAFVPTQDGFDDTHRFGIDARF